MDLLKDLVDSFIPHAENEYRPHFFRMKAIVIVAVMIGFLGLGGFLVQKYIIENSGNLAAVISAALVDLANGDRASNGQQTLRVNPLLERGAQMKADDMARKSYFAHTSPEGLTPWFWFKQAGYNFVYAGENLAVDFSDSIDVERAWMNSPTHRANILNSHFTEIGIGISQGIYQGHPVVFVVQEFGSPANPSASFPTSLTVIASTTPVALPNTVASTTATTTPAKKPDVAVAVKGATTTVTTNVKGAETDEMEEKRRSGEHIEQESEPKVIAQNDTFVAVRADVATVTPATAVAISPDSSVSLAQKFMTSPKSVVSTLYLVLASIIGLALVVMIGLEIKKQHPWNVAAGVLLILLMVGILYLSQTMIPDAVVAIL